MEYNGKNIFKKGRLAKAYNELPDIKTKEKVKQEYTKLLKSTSCKFHITGSGCLSNFTKKWIQ
jgi:hypothetical protein